MEGKIGLIRMHAASNTLRMILAYFSDVKCLSQLSAIRIC